MYQGAGLERFVGFQPRGFERRQMKQGINEILKHFDKTVAGLDPFTRVFVWVFMGLGSVLICLILFFILFVLVINLIRWVIAPFF